MPLPPSLIRINTLACRWEVDVSGLDADAAATLRELWRGTDDAVPDRSEPDGFPRTIVAAYDVPEGVDAESVILVPRELDEVAYAFSGAMTAKCLAAQAGRLTMFHAAALADPASGATVLLVAASGTGKSTAAVAFGNELAYLSDETAAVRSDLTVVPHAKPLSLHTADRTHKIERSPAELGLRPAIDTGWVAGTILLERDPALEQPSLDEVELIDAMTTLIPQTSSLPTQADPLDTLARIISSGAGAHRLRYAEIADAAPLVRALLAEATRTDQADRRWIAHPPPPGERAEPWTETSGVPDATLAAIGADTRLRRGRWLDAIEADGEYLLLNGPTPVRLMGLGATIWRRAEHPASVTEIGEAVIAEHGPHPDADRVIVDAVRSLAREGVLQLV